MSAVTRIGLFGGSFDPPHIGHFIPVRIVAELLQLDKVIVIPSALQPHKRAGAVADGEDRYLMVAETVKNDPLFEVSRIELDRGGVSYTIETLEEMSKRFPGPDYRLFLIIGKDSWAGLDRWKQADRLGDYADIVAMERTITDKKHFHIRREKDVTFVNTPLIDVSSTVIRQRIAAGKSVHLWISSETERIIRQKRLYHAKT